MVQVKFLALDEADRMLDMGTLAYFGKFFFWKFQKEKQQQKWCFWKMSMSWFVFSFCQGGLPNKTWLEGFLNLNLPIPR